MTRPALPNPFAEMSAAWRAVAAIVAVEPEMAPELLALKLETAVAGALKGHLTKQQVRWAAQHDWFLADLGNGLIQVANRWFSIWDGEQHEEILVWDKSFSELRDWAGY